MSLQHNLFLCLTYIRTWTKRRPLHDVGEQLSQPYYFFSSLNAHANGQEGLDAVYFFFTWLIL